MKEFLIDFSGYVEVEAETEEEARNLFWEELHHAQIEIDCVEEKE